MKIKRQVIIQDALYNCCLNRGSLKGFVASSKGQYARGIVVGLVAGLMSVGFTHEAALAALKKAAVESQTKLTPDYVRAVLPEGWTI